MRIDCPIWDDEDEKEKAVLKLWELSNIAQRIELLKVIELQEMTVAIRDIARKLDARD